VQFATSFLCFCYTVPPPPIPNNDDNDDDHQQQQIRKRRRITNFPHRNTDGLRATQAYLIGSPAAAGGRMCAGQPALLGNLVPIDEGGTAILHCHLLPFIGIPCIKERRRQNDSTALA
jgi:hypothetical protein